MSLRNLIVTAIASLILVAHSLGAATELADAAETNDSKRVLKLINESSDLDAAQIDGMTALHWACYHDNTDTAIALIKSGASVAAQNRYGVTPLSIACENGNSEIVDILLEAGADPNTALDGGETVLMTSARTGKLGPVKSLIKAGANVEAKEHNNQTAIIWAAAEGHVDVVKALVDAGADYKTPLKSGFTPFFLAVRQGHAELARYFISIGIDVNDTMDPKGNGRKNAKSGTSALILAMENGYFDLAVEFLDLGADPNDERSGYTPLHTLTWVRKPDRGEGPAGAPPPDVAGSVNSIEFVRELVKHGADVNKGLDSGQTSRRGRIARTGATPFFMAADTADLAYLKLLVELGADHRIPNVDGATPLMTAAGLGSLAPEEEAGTTLECLEAVKYIVSLGADVNTVDKNGETAMHAAAYKNAPEVVEFLHGHGAEFQIWNTKNDYGWTPVYIAEGYRPGNFKPSFATVDALANALADHGQPFPAEPRPKHVNYAP